MARKSKAQIVSNILENTVSDKDETIKALRLQVCAWRQVACLAVDDPDLGRKYCKSVFFSSLPFVNDVELNAIIEETLPLAEKSSVFNKASL